MFTWTWSLCTHREFFSKSYWLKPKSDCIYYFPIDLEPNGRPFGSKSMSKLVDTILFRFDLTWFRKNFSVCKGTVRRVSSEIDQFHPEIGFSFQIVPKIPSCPRQNTCGKCSLLTSFFVTVSVGKRYPTQSADCSDKRAWYPIAWEDVGSAQIFPTFMHWENDISISFHIEWDIIVVTRFPFDFEPNGIPFGSKSKGKLSPRSCPIQCERIWKYSFLSVQIRFFKPNKGLYTPFIPESTII